MPDLDPFPLSNEQQTTLAPYKLKKWVADVVVEFPPTAVDVATEAVATVMRRHHALRLQLVRDDDDPPKQRVLPPVDPTDIPILAAGSEQAISWRQQPLDPFKALSRTAVLIDASALFCALRVHHLAWDAWSRSILERDLARALALHSGASDRVWPALKVNFQDHVEMQRRAGTAMTATQLEYWRGVIEGAKRRRLHASERKPQGGPFHRSSTVASTALVSLTTTAREARCTPSALITAALAQALAEVSAERDQLVHIVHHGRDRPELLPVIGFFARSVPIRCDFTGCATLPESARRFMITAAEAIEQSRPPFSTARLSYELKHRHPEISELAQAALASVTINVQPFQIPPETDPNHPANAVEDSSPGGLRPSPTPRPNRLWLTANIGRRVKLWAEYDASIYPDDYVAEVLRRGAELLATVTA